MGTFKKILDILRKIVIGYVFYTFILTLMAFVILPELQTKSTAEAMDLILSNPIYTVAVVQIFIWSLTSCFLSFFMFFAKNTREILVKKLSGIKERDEREVQIVGKAFRASYLGTMTILLFVLFISLIKVEVSVKPVDNVKPGQHSKLMTVNGGIDTGLIDSDAVITQKEGYISYFRYNNVPLSTSALILILIIWQIVSFRVISRRESKIPE